MLDVFTRMARRFPHFSKRGDAARATHRVAPAREAGRRDAAQNATPPKPSRPRTLTLKLLLLLLLTLAACDTDVAILTDAPDAAFALNGFLDTAADTQFVRVERLRATFAETDRRLAGTLTSTGPDGAVRVWRDSTLALEDGARVTLAYAVFAPDPGTHLLEVRADDGATASVRVVIPAKPQLTRGAGTLTFSPRDTVLAETAELPLTFRPLDPLPVFAEARYAVTVFDSLSGATPEVFVADYRSQLAADASGGAATTPLRLRRDARSIRSRYIRADSVRLDALTFILEQRGPAYTDPAAADLQDAVGFVGGVGRHTFPISIGADTLRVVGFAVP